VIEWSGCGCVCGKRKTVVFICEGDSLAKIQSSEPITDRDELSLA
jgi:hypothetical protein